LTALKPAEICEKTELGRIARQTRDTFGPACARHRAAARVHRSRDARRASSTTLRGGARQVFCAREIDAQRAHNRDQKVTLVNEICHSP
jgi:hypothetical protein